MNDLKTPPSSVAAERAVLGSILIDTTSRSGDRVMDLCLTSGVNEETFFDPRNRTIYSTMLAMNRQARPLDPLTLTEEMKASGKFEAIGGAGYLQSVVDQVPTASHAEHYISIILSKQLRRTLIERSSKVIENCYDEGEYPDPRILLGEAEKSFLEIDSGATSSLSWSAAVDASFRRIDRMFDTGGKEMEGLSTGLRHLDEKIQGLKPSEMIVIAARPSVGKTSLAMNIAESCALGQMLTLKNDMYPPVECDGGKRHPVAIFSLEMPVEALSKRMIAGRAHVNMWRVNRNLVPKNERNAMTSNLMASAGDLKGAEIYVDDTAALDVMDLRARARRLKKLHGIELVVIDYLQLCTCRDAARHGSRQIEVSMISQQIKAMAKELKIPVIVLSQLSRANEQRGDKYERPKLSDLRDSGAIEQDADMVFLLRRPSRNANDPDSKDELLAIIDVAKNRNGETGEVKVNFRREYVRFEDRPLDATGAAAEAFANGAPSQSDSSYTRDKFMS